MRQGPRVRNPSFGVNSKQTLSPLLAGPHRLHPPRSSEKDVLIPEERSTSAAQFVSASPLTRGFAQISARQRPQPASLGTVFSARSRGSAGTWQPPQGGFSQARPPRAALPPALRPLPPPRVPPAVPAAMGARLGQAAPRRAPPGAPCIKKYKFNNGRRRRKEGAAPERSRQPRGPIGSQHPPPAPPARLFSKRRSLTALSSQWARRGGGSAPAAGLFPAVPSPGSGGWVPREPPGRRLRRGAAGR